MTFYDFTSTILTVVGYLVLVYRIIFELESGKMNKSRQEKLCTKWLIFTIFTTCWRSSRLDLMCKCEFNFRIFKEVHILCKCDFLAIWPIS
jgi:hypothetical protein